MKEESSVEIISRRRNGRVNSRLKKLKKLWPLFLIVAVILTFSFLWSILSSSSSAFNFVFSRSHIKSTDDRVSILLLGVGGEGHDGPYLTDSIIVVSYNLKTKRASLISIPRDLWLQDPGEKVNQVYADGVSKGQGLSLAEDKIDNILGFPIHYGVRIDFSGFEKGIDLVGGIDVNIERTFDDYQYPVDGKENDLCGLREKEMDLTAEQAQVLNLSAGKQKVLVNTADKVATDEADFACRFEHIHFDSGKTHLDGVTALKFVRSRHGTGTEGSDFARSKRQQLVVEAFREKLLSLQTLSNPQKMTDLIKTFGKSIETDIPAQTYLEFYNLSKKVIATDSLVLGDLGNGKSFFINPPPSDYGGSWVLIPPDNDFTQVKQFLQNRLNGIKLNPNPSP